ncbi:acyltransferase [Streptomyces sp. NPDC048514]|uniref:acyltransferase family protein n=1 Tax=Streptomyces sp. NPDC048514 TaxID=3365564 RepID=UPI003711DF0C
MLVFMHQQKTRTAKRDVFIDIIRASSIFVVIAEHWLMPVLSFHDGRLFTGNALNHSGWWGLTWLTQVMPMVFFAGGAANFFSYRGGPADGTWLRARIVRLLLPVVPMAGVWLVLPTALVAAGAPEQPALLAGHIAGQLLWFLAVYLLVVAATPVMVRLHHRYAWRVPVALGLLALLVDALRFEVSPAVGYANAVFVWFAVHQMGFFYADGGMRRFLSGAAAKWSVAGFAVTALAVAFGPYPGSMIGMPGAPVSNMSPPTALMISLAVGQLGLWLALRPVILRLASQGPVEKALRWSGSRFMTLYLWHMPALVVIAGVSVLGFHYATPAPGRVAWFAAVPLWVASAAVVLGAFVRLFDRFERRSGSDGADAASTGHLALAAVAASGGLLGLAARGFTTSPLTLTGTGLWVSLVLLGLLTAHGTGRRRTAAAERGTVSAPAPGPRVGC